MLGWRYGWTPARRLDRQAIGRRLDRAARPCLDAGRGRTGDARRLRRLSGRGRPAGRLRGPGPRTAASLPAGNPRGLRAAARLAQRSRGQGGLALRARSCPRRSTRRGCREPSAMLPERCSSPGTRNGPSAACASTSSRGARRSAWWLRRIAEAVGIGSRMIAEASELYLSSRPGVSRVLAEVLEHNRRSASAFERAGYVPAGIEPPPGSRMLAYTLA